MGYLPESDKVHFINFKGETLSVVRLENGLWCDADGGVWAFADSRVGDDSELRCGIGFLSLSQGSPLTRACAIHDYQYSSPAYQLFYTREEADRDLRRNIRQVSKGKWYRIFAQPFKSIVDVVGSLWWENKNTR